jgi:hypothetical protein
MTRASGLLLVLSGLAVGAYSLENNEIGETSPSIQRANPPVLARTRLATPLPGRAPETPTFSVPVVVTVTPHRNAPVTSVSRVAIPKDQDALARELQKELRRVGCYDGAVNGSWTPATQRAMKTFTDRVNASLPIDKPDPILYVMVKGQSDQICGMPCPAGQDFSEDGRCLPLGIIAKAKSRALNATATLSVRKPQAVDKPSGVVTGWSMTTTAGNSATAPPLTAPVDGRMALAGPAPLETTPATAPLPSVALKVSPVFRAPRPHIESTSRGAPHWSRTVFASDRSSN